MLVKCDPSIKAIIMKIDSQHGHDIVIEDIDEEYILVKSQRIDDLKGLLKDVRAPNSYESSRDLTHNARPSKIPSKSQRKTRSLSKCTHPSDGQKHAVFHEAQIRLAHRTSSILEAKTSLSLSVGSEAFDTATTS